jgi:hypothetical protein
MLLGVAPPCWTLKEPDFGCSGRHRMAVALGVLFLAEAPVYGSSAR